MEGSTRFDRAAGYYDATRGRSPDGVAKETDTLASELRDRGRVLEVGVGTGQVSLPLHDAGISMAGIDLSSPMIDVLRDKVGGRVPFPITIADATAMPFRDDAFGAAVLRWVLHLIPNWHHVLDEMVRVVGPGGVALMMLGGGDAGPRERIQHRFAEIAGRSREPVGLDWHGNEDLDRAMLDRGARIRELAPFHDVESMTLEDYMRGVEGNMYSWTWPLEEDDRRRTAAEVRAWAEAEYGALADVPLATYEVRWRAYDL
jgi:SAM-dependent methyltransferase